MTGDRPRLEGRVVPSLLVRDMGETLAFYERLGFEITGRDSPADPPAWAEVTRDAVSVQFYSEPPVHTPAEPVCSGTLYLFPDSVTAMADEFVARGVELAWGPEVMEYGMLEFGLRDPNGYVLAFTEPAG